MDESDHLTLVNAGDEEVVEGGERRRGRRRRVLLRERYRYRTHAGTQGARRHHDAKEPCRLGSVPTEFLDLAARLVPQPSPGRTICTRPTGLVQSLVNLVQKPPDTIQKLSDPFHTGSLGPEDVRTL